MSGSRKKREVLTQERLRELFNYDPETGIMTRRISIGYNTNAGDTVGCVGKNGYLVMTLAHKVYTLHRLIWLHQYGYLPEHEIDHINRDRTDNSLSNLREASRSCNARNGGVRSDNTSGVKGVGWYKASGGKWYASVYTDAKHIHLGYFDDFTEAVCHRYAVEQCLDYPNCDANSSAYQYLKQQGILK